VIHLSRSLAMEWAQRGIRVNSISPGYTGTPMNLRPEVADQVATFETDTPLGRMATVDELVVPAIFLVSDAASFCTGVDLLVDGGFHLLVKRKSAIACVRRGRNRAPGRGSPLRYGRRR